MAKVEKFSNAMVERFKLPPGKRQVDLFETLFRGRSLCLTVGVGSKAWYAVYYDAAKPRRVRLGSFPEMGCQEARTAAREFDAGQAVATARAGSFKDIAEGWFKRHVEERGLISAGEIRRHLGTYVYPKWETRAFKDIRRTDVNELLDYIVDHHGKAQADAVLATVRKMMRWYQSRDESYVCPIVPDMKRNKVAPQDRSGRWLTDDEIRAVWKGCDELGGAFAGLVKVLLLLGQRKEKTVTMRWEDIRDGVWHIPRLPREKGVPTAIALPPLALEVISSQPQIDDSPFVFYGRGKNRHFNSFSQRKAELDEKLHANMAPWVLHDLRRTTRKLLTRAKVGTDVAEMALGHSIRGIRAVYDDPSEYRDAIDAALLKVDAEVSRILNPDDAKVIAFPR